MTIYTHTARFDTARALTEDEMRKAAPSIFATAAHESRSERFQPIPTIEILRGLMAEGFMPVGAKQSGAPVMLARPISPSTLSAFAVSMMARFTMLAIPSAKSS